MKCRICDSEVELHYEDGLENKLALLQICFTCNFWVEKMDQMRHILHPIVDGAFYTIGEDREVPDHCKGFYGQRFVIRWKNGKIIETTNLWSAGKIPDCFRKYFPNTAEFVRRGKHGGIQKAL